MCETFVDPRNNVQPSKRKLTLNTFLSTEYAERTGDGSFLQAADPRKTNGRTRQVCQLSAHIRDVGLHRGTSMPLAGDWLVGLDGQSPNKVQHYFNEHL